jgi:plastocyanin/mono/diheme cytochrome c family protein
MRRPFLLGVLAALAVEAAVAVLVIGSGIVDVAATKTGGIQDRILAYASTRAIAHHAEERENPLAHDPAALKMGLERYRAVCVTCHGGPGAEPQEFAAGLHPAAPDLASPEVQSFTDGMLYETVARGIGSTGMPAFGPTHQPDQIWSIVAFVRHLPALTPEEKKDLGRKELGEGHEEAAAPPPHPPSQGQDGGAVAAVRGGQERHVHQVSISNFKFTPSTLEVHVGDVVEWKNTDFVAHTATADGRSFDTGGVQAGEAKRVIAKEKGRFPYFCRYHIAMKGTLVVQ